MKILRSYLPLVPAFIFSTAAAFGQTAWDTSVTDGFFDDTDNWSAGIPDVTTATAFNVAADTLITLRRNEASGATDFWSSGGAPVPAVGDQTTLTIDLGAYEYSIGTSGTGIFRPPSNADHTRTLVFNGDQDIEGNNLGLFDLRGTSFVYLFHTGNSSQGDAEVIVNSGATFSFDGILAVQWGRTWTSTVLVQVNEGGRFELTGATRQFIIANSDGNDAEFRVDGGVATHAGPRVEIAKAGDKQATSDRGGSDGRLTVINSGLFTTSGDIQAGVAIDSRAHIRVEGQDSILNAADVFLGGTSASTGTGTAEARFLDGGTGNFDSLHVFYTVHAPELEQDPTFGTLIVNGGHIDVAGAAVFQPQSVLDITINNIGQPLAIRADTLTVTDAILQLSLGDGFSATIHDTVLLLEYADSLSGTFAGFSEGQTFSIDGYSFQFSYIMDSDDSLAIGLTVIPEPGTLALVMAILAGSLALIRKRP